MEREQYGETLYRAFSRWQGYSCIWYVITPSKHRSRGACTTHQYRHTARVPSYQPNIPDPPHHMHVVLLYCAAPPKYISRCHRAWTVAMHLSHRYIPANVTHMMVLVTFISRRYDEVQIYKVVILLCL